VYAGALTALELIIKLPLNVFSVVGKNWTLIVQVFVGARVVELVQVPPDTIENGEAGLVMEVNVRF